MIEILSDEVFYVEDISPTDEETTSEMIKSIDNHLDNIESGINHIFVIGILILVWIAIMKIFGNWYLGGV